MFSLLSGDPTPFTPELRIHRGGFTAAETSLGASRAALIEANRPGPRVCILGGQHGDEAAGAAAAAVLAAALNPSSGAVLVIPQANPAGCAALARFAPGWAGGSHEDLNRCWARPAGNGFPYDCPEMMHAAALWQTLLEFSPSLVIDLHESRDHELPQHGAGWAFLESIVDARLARAAGLPVEVSSLPHTLGWAARRQGWAALTLETRRSLPWRERILRHVLSCLSIAHAHGAAWSINGNVLESRTR